MNALGQNWKPLLAGLSLLLPDGGALAQENAASRQPDYAAFRVVTERNIFNASRSGRSTNRDRETRRPARIETFGLVGTMEYDRGPLAFFDGSSSDYRKALRPGDSIAGHRVETILTDSVTLRQASNTFALRLGSQVRREDDGPWQVSGQFDSAAAGSGGSGRSPSSDGGTSTNASDAGSSAGSGEVSDVLKRLMEKRERESK